MEFEAGLILSAITIELIIVTLFITIQLNKMALSNKEAVDKINALTTQVGKIGTEVTALKDIILSQGNVTPEVEAALANLENAVKGGDDLNEEAPGSPAE